MKQFKQLALGGLVAAAVMAINSPVLAAAKPLKSVGVTVGDLANPYFVAIGDGASEAAKKTGWTRRQSHHGIE